MRALLLLALVVGCADDPVTSESRVSCGDDGRYRGVETCHPWCLREPVADAMDICRAVAGGIEIPCGPALQVEGDDGQIGCCLRPPAVDDDVPWLPCE